MYKPNVNTLIVIIYKKNIFKKKKRLTHQFMSFFGTCAFLKKKF